MILYSTLEEIKDIKKIKPLGFSMEGETVADKY
jgi:hypothetical protein